MALKGEVIGLQQCDGARGEGDDQLQHEGGVHIHKREEDNKVDNNTRSRTGIT